MTYIEITVIAPEESRDALMSRMNEMGATGFIENDNGLTAYFEPVRSAAEICAEVGTFRAALEASGLASAITVSHNLLPERDWNETWKKNFIPMDVGENLVIIPSWLQASTDRIPVIIDPGMVFGTGHHETTRTCLCLIEKMAKTGVRKSFLDIGTGTGILAIGAARLGFEHVLAVDIDPLAVEAATRNVTENSLYNIAVKAGSITAASGTFDGIVANLLSEILLDIAQPLAALLNPGGTAILSGMLVGQEEMVIDAMNSAGLSLQDKIVDGKWITLVMKK